MNTRPPIVSHTPQVGTQPPAPTTRRHSPSPSWSTNWRNDHRYDWHNYRNRHRSLFHLGFYYDPFGWGYQPLRYRLAAVAELLRQQLSGSTIRGLSPALRASGHALGPLLGRRAAGRHMDRPSGRRDPQLLLVEPSLTLIEGALRHCRGAPSAIYRSGDVHHGGLFSMPHACRPPDPLRCCSRSPCRRAPSSRATPRRPPRRPSRARTTGCSSCSRTATKPASSATRCRRCTAATCAIADRLGDLFSDAHFQAEKAAAEQDLAALARDPARPAEPDRPARLRRLRISDQGHAARASAGPVAAHRSAADEPLLRPPHRYPTIASGQGGGAVQDASPIMRTA